jgi:hypothetical protein
VAEKEERYEYCADHRPGGGAYRDTDRNRRPVCRGRRRRAGILLPGDGRVATRSLDTFLKVTEPKTDLWLVQAFGVLVAVGGVVLLLAAVRRKVPLEIVTLGAGLALALAGIDIIFVLRRSIGPVYLIDALAQVGLVALWCGAMVRPPDTIRL